MGELVSQPRPSAGAAVVGVRVGMARSLGRAVMIGGTVPMQRRMTVLVGATVPIGLRLVVSVVVSRCVVASGCVLVSGTLAVTRLVSRCVLVSGTMAVTRLVDRYVAVVINRRMSMAVRVLLVACHTAYRGTPIRLRLQRSYAL